jgi:alpha-tubulin suppressor-like RCC1 family protein
VLTPPTPSDLRAPTLVTVAAATDVAVAGAHACALSSGVIRCWGDNNGRRASPLSGTQTQIPPTQVDNSTDYVALEASTTFACGLRQNGEVRCWGMNTGGQLGVDPAESGLIETVRGVSEATDIATGEQHACALVAGRAWCWGRVINSTIEPAREFRAPDGSEFESIDAGQNVTIATSATGVWCWGSQSAWGACGVYEDDTPTQAEFTEPVLVTLPPL